MSQGVHHTCAIHTHVITVRQALVTTRVAVPVTADLEAEYGTSWATGAMAAADDTATM